MVKKLNLPINQLKLIEYFKKLIPCIKGKWFMSDGCLLGHLRHNRSFIPWDTDIDIYLLPGSYIDKDMLKDQGLNHQKYYLCDKIYNKKNPIFKPKNKWTEFLDYTRVLPEHQGFNRYELLKASKLLYKEEYIEPVFTEIHIDVMYLEKYDGDYYYPYNYSNQNFTDYICYTNDMIRNIYYNEWCGIKVPIPYHTIDVLRMLYGPEWWKWSETEELSINDPVIKVN